MEVKNNLNVQVRDEWTCSCCGAQAGFTTQIINKRIEYQKKRMDGESWGGIPTIVFLLCCICWPAGLALLVQNIISKTSKTEYKNESKVIKICENCGATDER